MTKGDDDLIERVEELFGLQRKIDDIHALVVEVRDSERRRADAERKRAQAEVERATAEAARQVAWLDIVRESAVKSAPLVLKVVLAALGLVSLAANIYAVLHGVHS